MRYLLLIFAMFSLGSAPAVTAETCVGRVDMSVSVHAGDMMLDADMMDCCGMSENAIDNLSGDCASECAIACAGVFTGITPLLGTYEYEAAAKLHQWPANGIWLAQYVSFDPPPPRI